MTKETNKEITVYGISGGYCGYCDMAKALLEQKKLDFSFVEVAESDYFAKTFAAKGFRTVPQITIGDKHIGGYTDLVAYFEEGADETTD